MNDLKSVAEEEISNIVEGIVENLVKPFFIKERDRIFVDLRRIYKEARFHLSEHEQWLSSEIYQLMGEFQTDYQRLYKTIETKSRHNFLIEGWVNFFIHRTKNNVIESLVRLKDQLRNIKNINNGSLRYRFPDIDFDGMKWNLKNINVEDGDLNEIARNEAFEFKQTNNNQKIKLTIDLIEKPLIIYHIVYFTQEMLHELVKNSVLAIEEGHIKAEGEIIIQTKCLNGKTANLKVLDNGSGIPDDRLEKVFLDGFSSKLEGTGKGLNLTKIYVEGILKGHITIKNRRKGGAVLNLDLPLAH